ncbi:MAG: zinc ribbon domain-containing protein [Gaiellales bacterium]
MPTYEYRCKECSHQFEIFAKMSDPDPDTCPDCNAKALEKLLFPVAVHYKGSGFYSTDYGSKKSTKADAGAGSGEGEGGSSDSASSDSVTSSPAPSEGSSSASSSPVTSKD